MNESMPSTKQAFDQLARNYDSIFTNTNIGKMLRQRTHELLDEIFLPEDIVLVLNCGTGEDVLYLARRGIKVIATDSSAEMIKYARIKIKDGGLENRVIFKQIIATQLQFMKDSDLLEKQINSESIIISEFTSLIPYFAIKKISVENVLKEFKIIFGPTITVQPNPKKYGILGMFTGLLLVGCWMMLSFFYQAIQKKL